ncbi:hypothetical protein KIV45_15595 [Janthinobacterium lividum]|nr:hypothetical protein KIV45_15595 [Janthinobacterium lividum]
MFIVSFVCYTYWPDKDSSLPSWVQAVGAITAIIAAGVGIKSQIAAIEEDAKQRQRHEMLNLFKGLSAEIGGYRTSIASIKAQIDASSSVRFSEMLQIVFPKASPKFHVYSAIAGRVGLIEDDMLRGQVIALYADMDIFFAMLNMNSDCAIKNPADEVPRGEIAYTLKSLLPLILSAGEELIVQADVVKNALDQTINSRRIA